MGLAHTPAEGEVTPYIQQRITANLADLERTVDINTLNFTVTGYSPFTWGNPGLTWADSVLTFDPNAATPEVTFPHDANICVDIIVRDTMPNYGNANIMDPPYHFCFRIGPVYTCTALPNVITPGVSPGFNDFSVLTYPEMDLQPGILKVYSTGGDLVRTLTMSPGGEHQWDGKDDGGNYVMRGVFLYTIEVSGSVVCNGTITVIR